MFSNDLSMVVPGLREFITRLIKEAKEKLKLDIIVTNAARDIFVQSALYAQGRKTLEEVNSLRKIAGLFPIDAITNKKQVTWTMKSLHIINRHDSLTNNDFSYAVDIAIMKDKAKGVISWDLKADVNKDNLPDYKQVVDLGLLIAKDMNLPIEAGGRWKKPDYPHWQLSPLR